MPSHELHTEIEIAAPAERIWTILVDFAAYPQWNPFIRAIEGELQPGARLRVRLQPAGGKAMRFAPVVLTADAGRELRWRGRFLLPGVLDGEHFFVIEPTDDGRCRFVHGERFSGLLVGLARASLDRIRGDFEAMNRALKARAEA